MVQSTNGIGVYVLRYDDDRRYVEHTIPVGSPKYPGKQNEVYIEAVSGERFKIVTRLAKCFDFKDCAHVRIRYYIDSSGIYFCHDVAVTDFRQYLEESGDAYYEDGLNMELAKANGRWSNFAWVFTALSIDEDLDHDHIKVISEVESQGKIVVEVERGTLHEDEDEDEDDGFAFEDESVRNHTSSVAVIKNNHVSHTISKLRLEDVELEELAKPSRWEKEGPSRGGRTVRFVIRYRSRAALECLKIVPVQEQRNTQANRAFTVSDHSATPEVSTETSPAATFIKESFGIALARIQSQSPGFQNDPLPTDVAILPATPIVKSEASSTTVKQEPRSAIPALESTPSTIKRERTADDDDDDDKIQILSSCSVPGARVMLPEFA